MIFDGARESWEADPPRVRWWLAAYVGAVLLGWVAVGLLVWVLWP